GGTPSAYKNGACVGTSSLHAVGAPAAVKVEAECTDFAADNRDLCYFDLTVTDADGNRVPDACCALNCLVDGGTLLGIFSGDPKNEDQYTSAQCHAFEGRALAIVKADKPGCVTLTVGGAELASGRASAMAY
ncbi:MAG: hypothetical protein MJ175_04575, partial [Clostridia bacterium]|nr:hypothetical protein [Clostridia bacterium]